MSFYNRDIERKNIKNFFNSNSISDSSNIICIEGAVGTGKTEFMKYIIKKYTTDVFYIADKPYYKCENIYSDNDFAFIYDIIYDIYMCNQSYVEEFIYKYFVSNNYTSLLEVICTIIPEIKIFAFAKSLLQRKSEQLNTYKTDITNQIVHRQLVDFFSDLILSYISFKLLNKHITICIDDFQWIDLSSRKTIQSILLKSNNTEHYATVSFIVTIRSKSTLETKEKNNYNTLFDLYNEHFSNKFHILLSDFGELTTYGILSSSKNNFLIENKHKIYKITKGNPQEIFQALTLDSNSLEKLIAEHSKNSEIFKEEYIVTTQSILDLYTQDSTCGLIINILSVIGCKISSNILFKILSHLLMESFKSSVTVLDYKEKCCELQKRRIIRKSGVYFEIYHDSIKSIVCDYLKNSSEYSMYVDIIANFLLNEKEQIQDTKNSNIYVSIKLYSDVKPLKGFFTFVRNIKKETPITPEICEIVAKCFCNDFLNVPVELQENVVVKIILPALFNYSKLNLGETVSNCLHMFYKQYSIRNQITFLTYFIRILVDTGKLRSNGSNPSAVVILDELYSIDILDANLQVDSLLLGMSVYEHLLEYEKIENLYNRAKDIIQNNSNIINDYILSKFFRNEGLYFSHRDLLIDYQKAINHAKKISNDILKNIMLGTTHNNLGLAYFYSAEISKALKEFQLALKYLSNVGNNLSRVYNNIGICLFLLGKNKAANDKITYALNCEKEGEFTNICIKTNYSIVLDAIGNNKEATSILDIIIEDYFNNNLKCNDLVAYSSALLNRAFLYIKNNNYLKAYTLIKESKKQNYRFEQQLQSDKRNKMMQFCLYKEKILDEYHEIYLDWNNDTLDIYRKPYSLIPLAFYVI